ncbi:MAG: glycyl-radical enzyme activating protein, partial [bacterium]
MNNTGIVFNIQRFSIHDGPGIRTTIFMKGCSMRCFWCHNPEGRHRYSEIQFYADRCIGCGECVTACPNNAHEMRDRMHIFNRERCTTSAKCVETCYASALELTGKQMTVEQVMEEVLSDRLFYENSHGGITLSGGEPVINSDFARSILERCKEEDLHTAIETCGNYQWDDLVVLLPITDLIMIDIKHLDSDKHRKVTGASN